ncbi:MerR family transcriptional regulator [Halobacillus shinanisalinarum]|uniref:MerR family transcriptional regulator n=1 Tax=Halobacillus shinanisalinarum TaxID=2932258 RepID=A0ABY4H391_9BACI|nr:MerR family transcriptional regulator [Halobacillus shinanisalinarum]UOQ94917.1 MerR family transcriptional regulator [Halobacillus shinanisalinarum]
MPMKVKEVAELVGISIRTLHHYDNIGLLTPQETTEAGYRLYSNKDLETLQQILFFKELDFPLKKIKEIITNPDFEQKEALQLHRKMLLEKRRRLDNMILTVEKTIQQQKGEIHMTNKDKFEGFDFSRNPYEQEARERWGDEAVDRSNAKLNNMSQQEKDNMSRQMDTIYKRLATLRHDAPGSDSAQAAIKEWYFFMSESINNDDLMKFKGIGQLYIDDERFTNNIDNYGEGLAAFMRDAMALFADSHKK